MSDYYDVHGRPMSLLEWADTFEQKRNRRVGSCTFSLGGARLALVSTVWLGLDHSFGGGRPLIFETMVFFTDPAHELHEYTERYSTLEEATLGHVVMRLIVAERLANEYPGKHITCVEAVQPTTP